MARSLLRSIFRRLAYVFGAIVVVMAVAAAIEWNELRRLYFANRLFSGADQVDNFRNMRALFPVRDIKAPPQSLALDSGPPMELPKDFKFDGKTEATESFLSSTDTTGLLVMKDGKVVYERYWRGNDVASRSICWSVSKSFVSALIGISVHDGAIKSIEDPVTNYLPELKGSAYDGVRIKDVLQMSSGASWNEDYSDWNSDINRFGRTFALGRSLTDFVTSLKREHEPGTYNRYNSMDTQVLGMLLKKTTGKSLAEYLQEKIWLPLGMEKSAWWVTDDFGAEFAAGGMNATLRDYARFGFLYLNKGEWNGVQVIPTEWIRQSITPDAPHLMPGKRASAESQWGYGYQWWIPDDSGDFSAVGAYNQFIYVSPRKNLVIAKTSANHLFGTTDSELSDKEEQHIAFFKAIESSVGN